MSLSTKLKINPALDLWVIGAEEEEALLFADTNFQSKIQAKGSPVLQLVLFVKSKKELDDAFPKVKKQLSNNSLLWVCYPKKSGSIVSDLIRDEGWQVITDSDWEGVASASINDNWSGMRFKHKSTIKSMKRAVPMGDRQTEGVDYVNRIVQLPKDAILAMSSYQGLEEFFNNLSFTHKREYVEAIVDAKKPETRVRRIEKMIEMVGKLKSAKKLKK